MTDSTLDLTITHDASLYYTRHDVSYVYERVLELVQLHHSNEDLTPTYITATLLATLTDWSNP